MQTHVAGNPLRVPAAPVDLLHRSWWLMLLRGIAAVIFGILAFTWPGHTLVALVILYGAYALTDGVLSIAAAICGRGRTPVGWLIFVGVLGILAGLATFTWPHITALVLLALIGVWAILHGALEIAGAIRLRREIHGEFFLILSGLISVVFGLFVLFRPGAGALAIVWLIAFYAVLFGVLLIALSFRLRAHQRVAAPA